MVATHPPSVKSGAELMEKGLPVTLSGEEISDLIFFEVAGSPISPPSKK